MIELARASRNTAPFGRLTDERQRGGAMTELTKALDNTALPVMAPTSTGEEQS